MHKKGRENDWLEPILRRELTRVEAPPELWDRVVLPRVSETQPPDRGRFVWTIAVASAFAASMMAIVWGYGVVHAGTMTSRHRAEFTSTQPSAIRTWVRKQTGIDVPLLVGEASGAEMRGASIGGDGSIEIRYRAGNQDALLVVSARRDSVPGHKQAAGGGLQNSTTLSWTTGQNTYTLAVANADGIRAACVACHAEVTL